MTKTTQNTAPSSGTPLSASFVAAEQAAGTISPADLQSAVEAARTEAHAAGVDAGKAEATARIAAILTSPEAEGREAQARVLALETEMSATDAAKVLAASPKASMSASIADRAAQEAELGAETPADHRNRAERSIAGWAKAVTNANARFG